MAPVGPREKRVPSLAIFRFTLPVASICTSDFRRTEGCGVPIRFRSTDASDKATPESLKRQRGAVLSASKVLSVSRLVQPRMRRQQNRIAHSGRRFVAPRLISTQHQDLRFTCQTVCGRLVAVATSGRRQKQSRKLVPGNAASCRTGWNGRELSGICAEQRLSGGTGYC